MIEWRVIAFDGIVLGYVHADGREHARDVATHYWGEAWAKLQAVAR